MNNFKTRRRELTRKIERKKRELERLKMDEAAARRRWAKEYASFFRAANALTDMKSLETKRAARTKTMVKGWPERSVELTKKRDEARAAIREAELDLSSLSTTIAVLTEEENSQARATNEIVSQVFALNDAVVRAAADRDAFLARHVFPSLFDENGKQRSQVTWTSEDGLRRVVAAVNSITIVEGDMAARAKMNIEGFFDRFREKVLLTSSTQALYDLTRQLLVEKTKFKVGPDLYRFLGMELDGDVFPDLAEAQRLLRASIRSEKTNSYIRLFERSSRSSNWVQLKQR